MSSAFGNGSNSNGQFWYGSSINFPGFLYKKNVGVGGRRSTKFNPGGNVFCNKSNYFYNKYKPGTGGVGASSIANRRAKNRLATVCVSHNCFPCYNTLGQYSNYTHNPNGYIPCPIPKSINNRLDKTIVINGVTRYYTIFNIKKSLILGTPVLLCFHGGGETSNDMINYTQFNLIGNTVIFFQGQKSANTCSWQNAFPWLYKSFLQNDVLFVDSVLQQIYKNNIPNVFLTGKSDGAGFCALYSNLSTYKDIIKGIGFCSGAHFGLNNTTNITEFDINNCYADNNIFIPYNIVTPLKNISVFNIHGSADTTMPYDGEMYTDQNAYDAKKSTIWTEIDPSIHKTNGTVYTNTYTSNIKSYVENIQNFNNLTQTYSSSNKEYFWNSYNNDNNIVLNSVEIIGEKHSWSGHPHSGSSSSSPSNFYLDATYLLILFFGLDIGNYTPSVTTIPSGLKVYNNTSLKKLKF